jgi:hypothetical protein
VQVKHTTGLSVRFKFSLVNNDDWYGNNWVKWIVVIENKRKKKRNLEIMIINRMENVGIINENKKNDVG